MGSQVNALWRAHPSHHYDNALLLTFAGGFLDAYTYFSRGGVFANAQTGNTIKLAIYLAKGDFADSIRFIIPILAFILGTVIAIAVERVMEKHKIHFIRRLILILEMIIVVIVGRLPQTGYGNDIANALISLLCAMQMEGFKSFAGQMIITIVTMGNIRKSVEFLYVGISEHDREKLRLSLIYIIAVLVFCIGAALGTVITERFGVVSIRLLLLVYLMSFTMISIRWKRMGLPIIEK